VNLVTALRPREGYIARLLLRDCFIGSNLASRIKIIRCACWHVVLVRHENDCVSLTVQVCEKRHDLCARFRIEVSGGLVRQHNRSEFTSARAIATRASAAGESFGLWLIRSIRSTRSRLLRFSMRFLTAYRYRSAAIRHCGALSARKRLKV